MLIFFLTLLVGIPLTWYYFKSDLYQPVEKLAVWVFSIIYLKLTFTIIELNLQWFKLKPSVFSMITIYLAGWLFFAVLHSISAGVFLSRHIHWAFKMVMVLVGAGLSTLAEHLFNITGLLDFTKWNLWYSFVRHLILLGFTIGFAYLFRKLVRRGIARA